MKIQLKILAFVFLFFGYTLIAFVALGLFSFWGYWQEQSSVLSDSAAFQRAYIEYFSAYNLSPLKSLLIAGLGLLIGYGLLKLKWWAGYIAFIFCLVNFYSFLQAITSVNFEAIYLIELVFAIYGLVILFGNKEMFIRNRQIEPTLER